MKIIDALLNFIVEWTDKLLRIELTIHIGDPMNAMNDKIPTTPDQDVIMCVISSRSCIRIEQSKKLTYAIIGPKMNVTDGVFSNKDKHPKQKTDIIAMNADAHTPYWYSVLFHELAHATGTAMRLNRPGISMAHVDAITYAYEEIIAEKVASRIMERMGLATEETREASLKYINRYASNIETLIEQKKLNKEVEAAETMVMGWIVGIEFKAA